MNTDMTEINKKLAKLQGDHISIPVCELEKLEKVRRDLYEKFYEKLDGLERLEFQELTQQIWRIANTKVWR